MARPNYAQDHHLIHSKLDTHDEDVKALYAAVNTLTVDLAVTKTKVAIYGVLGGAIGGALLSLIIFMITEGKAKVGP